MIVTLRDDHWFELRNRLAAMEECLAIARRSGGNIHVAIKRIEAAANGECAKGVKADG